MSLHTYLNQGCCKHKQLFLKISKSPQLLAAKWAKTNEQEAMAWWVEPNKIGGPLLPLAPVWNPTCTPATPHPAACLELMKQMSLTRSPILPCYRPGTQETESCSNFPTSGRPSTSPTMQYALGSWKGSHFKTRLLSLLPISISSVFPCLKSLIFDNGWLPSPQPGYRAPSPTFQAIFGH